jgi:hypothetical protein
MTTRQYRLIAVLAATALAGALLAGCGQSGDRDAAPGGSVSATPIPSNSGPTGQPNLSPSPLTTSGGISGGKSPDAGGEITLTGEIEEGVEAGCMLLRAGDRAYLLLGGDREMIRKGGRVTVRGKAQPGLMTTCQQGTPFQVAEIRRA